MGKIGLVTAKYIVHAHIMIEGTVDRPDVIGAIFGQTEGLLGAELELRELQRNGKIGRIEVDMTTVGGKASGDIIIPSSLDKAETAIIAAALETIQRIGPCNANVKAKSIEDVRVSKRAQVNKRAKELLRTLTDSVLPDSQEITEEVAQSVRVMEITEYGKDRLAAGPAVEDSDEIIIVEGRADVLNLLKNGIKNSIAMNGTSVPQTIIELSRRKTVTVFVDGDRGGDLIIRELKQVAEIDFIAKAPDGKEVEEITKKEINKALRGKIAIEQVTMELANAPQRVLNGNFDKRKPMMPQQSQFRPRESSYVRPTIQPQVKNIEAYTKMLEDLTGTRGAYILDEASNILGKVPTSELAATIKNLGSGINTIVFDGIVDRDLVKIAEKSEIKNIVAMESKVPKSATKINIITK